VDQRGRVLIEIGDFLNPLGSTRFEFRGSRLEALLVAGLDNSLIYCQGRRWRRRYQDNAGQ
jgi:hypothetical protein